MMSRMNLLGHAVCVVVACGLAASTAWSDTFGSGENEFSINFVAISGATNPTSGYGIVNNDYRIGTHEITNDQWDKFVAEHGKPTGLPANAYNVDAVWLGANKPANGVSWYEAAQFVNWLNAEAGYHAAYKFDASGNFGAWTAAEADGDNLFRHKDAFYYLPTENEWVKAAYWDGAQVRQYATTGAISQGTGTSGTGWNYYTTKPVYDPMAPWDAGSGSEELNGTHDMMGNVLEWCENNFDGTYTTTAKRETRGGGYSYGSYAMASDYRALNWNPLTPSGFIGFRVASEIPEPGTVTLISLGALVLAKKARAGKRQ